MARWLVLAVRPAPVAVAPLVLVAVVPLVLAVPVLVDPAVRVPQPVPVAPRVPTCRAVPAAVTTRASRCRVLAFVPVDPVVAPAVLVDPAAVLVVGEAPVAVVARPVRSASRRASVVAPLRSSLLPR